MPANLLALGAIALWSTLAALGVSLATLPPFLLTGVALIVGSAPAWPLWRQWRVPPGTLALGVAGLFGYHFLLFVALRLAPPIEANLVNYLWPLLIVVLAPVLLRGMTLRPAHLLAALVGFAGAALAILAGSADAQRAASPAPAALTGYAAAAGAALTWACYSLLTRRVASFSTGAVGLFALVSGLLSLGCHAWLETPVALEADDLALLAAIGLGPMGAAFYLWDRALKTGDARVIGLLSYLTPLGSTALLLAVTGRALSWQLGLATALVVASAMLGLRASRAGAVGRTAAK
jgi:drug/metabolite transporter (DMT)-like permease